MKIKNKLLLQAILLAVVPALVTALIITLQASRMSFTALEKKAQEQLISLRELKKTQITSYLDIIDAQVLNLSKNSAVMAAADQLIDTFAAPEAGSSAQSGVSRYYNEVFTPAFVQRNPDENPDIAAVISQLDETALFYQQTYIVDNRFPLGSKDQLFSAGDTSYDQVHEKVHPLFRDYLTRFGYYDIFIVDASNGRIVYSVFKELDYATSLATGPYADSGLAKVFNQAVTLPNADSSVLIDFSDYFPSYDQAASFIASPIANAAGEVNAVLIFQMPVDAINNIMTNNNFWQSVGLGASGETYLVGPDNLLRSESRFLIEDPESYYQALADSQQQPHLGKIKARQSALGLQLVNTSGVDAALKGQNGFARFNDYRSVEVLSAYSYFDFGGQRWALLAEIDVDEALGDAEQLSGDLYTYMLVSLMIIGFVAVALGWQSARTLVKPINQLVERITDISEGEGDLTAQLTLAERDDEIGEVGKAFNQFVAKIRDIIIQIDHHAEQLATSSEELSVVTHQTNKIVELQKGKTDQASRLMSEFSSSIEDITANSVDTETLTNEASGESVKGAELSGHAQTAISELVASVNDAAAQLQQLNIQVGDISGILGVIDSIADQTNLLALNAAIEAARAGEFGRGFAVVADEVRSLAGKTQESTVEIQKKIDSLRSSTNQSVSVMENAVTEASKGGELVKNTADSLIIVADLVANVSSKNSENTAVAKQQGISVKDVHQNIIDIASHSESTASASLQTTQASDELAKLAVSMSGIVQQFKY